MANDRMFYPPMETEEQEQGNDTLIHYNVGSIAPGYEINDNPGTGSRSLGYGAGYPIPMTNKVTGITIPGIGMSGGMAVPKEGYIQYKAGLDFLKTRIGPISVGVAILGVLAVLLVVRYKKTGKVLFEAPTKEKDMVENFARKKLLGLFGNPELRKEGMTFAYKREGKYFFVVAGDDYRVVSCLAIKKGDNLRKISHVTLEDTEIDDKVEESRNMSWYTIEKEEEEYSAR